mmetsp:Transcript_42392/g.105814  ORF Transcript_42392/g.105814 Transcript_42392/m.105814 type:complete len:206 (-) Transcript_42392:61-678(-)
MDIVYMGVLRHASRLTIRLTFTSEEMKPQHEVYSRDAALVRAVGKTDNPFVSKSMEGGQELSLPREFTVRAEAKATAWASRRRRVMHPRAHTIHSLTQQVAHAYIGDCLLPSEWRKKLSMGWTGRMRSCGVRRRLDKRGQRRKTAAKRAVLLRSKRNLCLVLWSASRRGRFQMRRDSVGSWCACVCLGGWVAEWACRGPLSKTAE